MASEDCQRDLRWRDPQRGKPSNQQADDEGLSPGVEFVLDHKWLQICGALAGHGLSIPVYFKLGSEFMPPLMKARSSTCHRTPRHLCMKPSEYWKRQDKIIRAFPEVERVFGKAGRAGEFQPIRPPSR